MAMRVEDKAMSVREFRDDDVGYLAWLAAHPDGYERFRVK